jgi:hypothetical protein
MMMMIITPHLGIGDIIILRIKDAMNKLDITDININTLLLKTQSENYENKLCFIKQFIRLLFPNVSIELTEGPCDFDRINPYPFKNTYLYNKISYQMLRVENKYSDYIVFHTKIRYDHLIGLFNQEVLPSLIVFLETFKTSKTILILGEKEIGQNYETTLLQTTSLYNHLLLLRKNNTVIDLTKDVLTAGNPDFNDFLTDIEIINDAVCNVTFGIGGPFNICMAFSTKHIAFVPFYKLSNYVGILEEINQLNHCIIENVEEIGSRIESACEII